jgi:hypothetical protein
LPRAHIGTLTGLIEHDDKLVAYCLRFKQWAVHPLASLVAQGKGSLRLPINVR